jgi:hypothetical protein
MAEAVGKTDRGTAELFFDRFFSFFKDFGGGAYAVDKYDSHFVNIIAELMQVCLN